MQQVVEQRDELITQNGNGVTAVSFADMLADYEYIPPRQGDIITAEVLRVADDVVLMDVGAKRDAIVPTYEIAALDELLLAQMMPGDEIPVFIMRTPVGAETLEVSVRKGLEEQDWQRAADLLASEESVELEIVGNNKGGILVEFGLLRGFVPNSHVPELNRLHDAKTRHSWKQRALGSMLTLKVIEVDRSRNRLVLSARQAEAELQQQELLSLQVGDVVNGRVEHLVNYGAFIRLNHISGLLHISRISWENIDHPRDVLQVGDELDLLVDKVDVEAGKISLNRRALLPSPWDHFTKAHQVDDLVEGVVTTLTDFGAFIQTDHGIEGLAHISEIDIAAGSTLDACLRPGEVVLTRIISIEPERQRLGLSLRRVSAQEQIDWIQSREYPDSGETAVSSE